MPDLQQEFVRRLVLVKQMFLRAAAESNDTTPIGRILAVQLIDFCAESLLKTIVSRYGSPADYTGPQSGYHNRIEKLRNARYSRDMDFYRLCDEVVAIFRDSQKGINEQSLPLRNEIESIHKLRNDVQHDGLVPSPENVRYSLSTGEAFLRSVLSIAFSKQFDEIMLADLVQNTELRDLMHEAEKKFAQGIYKESIVAAARAYRLATVLAMRAQPYGPKGLSPFAVWDVEKISRELGGAFRDVKEMLEFLEE